MEAQSRIQEVTTILGESLVVETITKLAHIEGQKCLRKIDSFKSELARFLRNQQNYQNLMPRE